MNKSILIVGYGTVGSNLHEEIRKLNPEIYDNYKEIDTRTKDHYDAIFVCVDTPYISEEIPCDTSAVKDVIQSHSADLFIIKSTIEVGTTDRLISETNKNIVFSPEYYGGTHHANAVFYPFTIFGGHPDLTAKAVQIMQYVYTGKHTFKMVDAKTAELTKYMENSFLATKVSFMNSFWNICQETGIKFEQLRELFLLDPRMSPYHTYVYEDHPYWQTHCLDKDVTSIALQFDNKFLKSVIAFNEEQKKSFKK